MYTEFIKSEIKLTIGVIVSNHLDLVKKGMESIKPILNAVPSELIVVDTVGAEKSDGSLDVAKQYTDKIFHFDWIGDFAAARNVAMEHAKGEWFMFFDDDEYFDDVSEIIEFFLSDECEKYNAGRYYSGNYDSPDHYNKVAVSRLVKRTKNTCFEGIIHEHFNECYLPIKQFNVFTHHFGYLYQNEELKKQKKERNTSLLEKELQIKGYNLRTCAHLVQELISVDYDEAARRSLVYVEELKKRNMLNGALAQWLILVNIRNMSRWAILDIILSMEKSLKERYALSETARLLLDHNIISAAFTQKRYKELNEYVKDYISLYDWLSSHEQECIEQATLDLSMTYSEEYYAKTLAYGIVGEMAAGNIEKALEYYERLDLNYCPDNEEVHRWIVCLLVNCKEKEYLESFYRKFYRDELFDQPDYKKYLPIMVAQQL